MPRREWSLIQRDDLFVQDLTLAGVVETPEGPVAFAYAPGTERKIVPLETKTKLRDASVAAVGADGVTFDNGAKLTAK